MSVPVFFKPHQTTSAAEDPLIWDNFGLFIPPDAKPPKYVKFVDGGIVSNFPYDVFHVHGNTRPTMPTFGVKLEEDPYRHSTNTFLKVLASLFNSARHMYDKTFQINHPVDFESLVRNIPTKNTGWLDFKMSEEDKTKLFLSGAETAYQFLKVFDFQVYAEQRENGNLAMPYFPCCDHNDYH